MKRLLAILAPLILAVAFAYAEEVTGPAPVGANVTRPPVVMGGTAFPSPDASPVLKGRTDRLATDGNGALWVKLLGTVSTSSSGNITLQPGTSAANVTLPAASPVPVQGMLPLASPVGTLTSLPVVLSSGLTTGYTTYCQPEFIGGSAESTVKSGQGLLLGGHASTNSTADTYLLLWDASNPTPGTTAPLATLLIPASPSGTVRAMSDFYLPPPGLGFTTALTATTATASNGSTAPSGNVTLVLFIK